MQQYHDHQSKSPQLSQGAFAATFKGEKAKKPKDCLYGETHHFKQCPYILEGAQQRDWKPDPRIEQEIKEKIQSNKKLQGIINRIQAEAREREPPGAF